MCFVVVVHNFFLSLKRDPRDIKGEGVEGEGEGFYVAEMEIYGQLRGRTQICWHSDQHDEDNDEGNEENDEDNEEEDIEKGTTMTTRTTNLRCVVVDLTNG